MQELLPREFAALAARLRAVSSLSDGDLHELRPLLRVSEVPRGAFLLRAGEVARNAILVVHGLLREYFVRSDGTERTKAFVTDGGASGSLADLLSGEPSQAFIIAEENSRLCLVDFAALSDLYARSPAWHAYEVAFTRRLLQQKARREQELVTLDAEERYSVFRERYPGLETRIAARHVASYIAVTPVHLSRLRRKRRPQSR